MRYFNILVPTQSSKSAVYFTFVAHVNQTSHVSSAQGLVALYAVPADPSSLLLFRPPNFPKFPGPPGTPELVPPVKFSCPMPLYPPFLLAGMPSVPEVFSSSFKPRSSGFRSFPLKSLLSSLLSFYPSTSTSCVSKIHSSLGVCRALVPELRRYSRLLYKMAQTNAYLQSALHIRRLPTAD